TEIRAIANMRAADVLILGSSLTQAGFSSDATHDYFKLRAVPYFLLGFGYGGASSFTRALIDKWHLAPKVLVINTTPFFNDYLSEPARDVLNPRVPYLWRLLLKSLFQHVHRVTCAIFPCTESQPAIFRSIEDGQWRWIGPYVAEKSVPIVRPEPLAANA